MPHTIMSVVGARPQFIKAAAVSRSLGSREDLREVMVHTGQHYDADMSDVFFEELAIPPPAFSLGISGGGHGRMTGRMLEALETVIEDERPALVLVYGDTNSTLAGALAAAKLRVPVAHVEAGMRSFNRAMPEETNRILTDHASDVLLCSTATAVANLRREGLTEGVHLTGDVMYDAVLFAAGKARDSSGVLERLGVRDGEFALATVHRAENTDDDERLGQVLAYLKQEASGMPIVFPVHPRTRDAAARCGLSFDGLRVCAPLGYLDMARLLSGAVCIYTDSGGLQKEAYFHRVPCVTLRDETEWVETVEAGWNRLWRDAEYAPEKREIADYGEGDAADKVGAVLAAYLDGR